MIFECVCVQNKKQNRWSSGGHVNVTNFCVFCRVSVLISVRTMLRTPPSNQRRSRWNRQPATLTNQREAFVFTPKLKYSNSSFNDDGVFVLTKRKHAPPTETEKEEKRQRKLQIKIKHVTLTELQCTSEINIDFVLI